MHHYIMSILTCDLYLTCKFIDLQGYCKQKKTNSQPNEKKSQGVMQENKNN
jgi:hypothetical protein